MLSIGAGVALPMRWRAAFFAAGRSWPTWLTMPGMAMKRDLTPQQLRAREMMKHVHPAYDCATVDFDRIAIGTGILCVAPSRQRGAEGSTLDHSDTARAGESRVKAGAPVVTRPPTR